MITHTCSPNDGKIKDGADVAYGVQGRLLMADIANCATAAC